jgi:hypothetical protein
VSCAVLFDTATNSQAISAITRASCQFYVKYVRGRPQAPEYFPGWPTCE